MMSKKGTVRVWVGSAGIVFALLALMFLCDTLVGNRFLSFYGRVVDEAGNGIAGVQIKVQVTTYSRISVPFVPFGDNKQHHERILVTDKNGDFSIRLRGAGVIISGVNAPGYYEHNDWIGIPRGISRNTAASLNRGHSRDAPVIYPMVRGVKPPPKRMMPDN